MRHVRQQITLSAARHHSKTLMLSQSNLRHVRAGVLNEVRDEDSAARLRIPPTTTSGAKKPSS